METQVEDTTPPIYSNGSEGKKPTNIQPVDVEHPADPQKAEHNESIENTLHFSIETMKEVVGIFEHTMTVIALEPGGEIKDLRDYVDRVRECEEVHIGGTGAQWWDGEEKNLSVVLDRGDSAIDLFDETTLVLCRLCKAFQEYLLNAPEYGNDDGEVEDIRQRLQSVVNYIGDMADAPTDEQSETERN